MRYKLCNILTDVDAFASDYPGLYWHDERGEAIPRDGGLELSGHVDFTTYFNGLSVEKWLRYTVVDNFRLVLRIESGRCSVISTSVRTESDGGEGTVLGEVLAEVDASEGPVTVDVELPRAKSAVCGFAIDVPQGSVRLASGSYCTDLDVSKTRPVELVLATTTFRKEEYITRNIELIRKEVLGCGDAIDGHFQMVVVDNGRTLDADGLSGGGVTVVPNANVGGAGGFARGMIAASELGATHVLLMDDDVRVQPESFKRTYNLLALANERYADAFINGAMLNISEPNHFFEDVSRVRDDGIYAKIKKDALVDQPRNLALVESADVEVENAYGAWWYSCIPMSAIREHGLPLPVFVRCDDVEYGIRCKPKYMTMNGICVWHEQFEGRFRASVDCYQYIRNFLIMLSVSSLDYSHPFMLRFSRTFHIYLRSMNYDTCWLMLDGLEDYLRGPVWLAKANGEEIIKRNGAKNEKLVPVESLSPEILKQAKPDMAYLGGNMHRSRLLKLIEMIPHDRHFAPDALLIKRPAPMYYSQGAYPARRTMLRRTLVAYDADATHAHVRNMDRERWNELRRRYSKLMQEYRRRRDDVAREWSEALPWLASESFWRSYLGMGESD